MKRFWFAAVLFVLMFLFVLGCGKGNDEIKATKAGMAQEWSATVVSSSAGQAVTMKVYIKPEKFRTDNDAAGQSTIVRKDLNKVWMLMTSQKTYMEMPGTTEGQVQMVGEKVKGEVSRKEVGRETVNGHPTMKYEVTAKDNDKVMQVYQWQATDINFPIKTAAIDGSWIMEYRDVKLSVQPDSLFEVPSGYKKLSIPGKAEMNLKLPGINIK